MTIRDIPINFNLGSINCLLTNEQLFSNKIIRTIKT